MGQETATISTKNDLSQIYLGNILLAEELPIGSITFFYGNNLDLLPSNWKVCDGTNGTPDLTDRFVIGTGSTSGYYSGGSKSVTEQIKLSNSEIPVHKHNITFGTTGTTHKGVVVSNNSTLATQVTDNGGSKNYNLIYKRDGNNQIFYSQINSITRQTEEDSYVQESLPLYKYYTLVYIMKVA